MVEKCLIKALGHVNDSDCIGGGYAHDVGVIVVAKEYR